MISAVLTAVAARPGQNGGGGGLQLDSYAAPIGNGGSSGSSGGYGPPPQYGPPQQAPVVHKHVYVHVPPPEPAYYPPRYAYCALEMGSRSRLPYIALALFPS